LVVVVVLVSVVADIDFAGDSQKVYPRFLDSTS